MLSLQDSWCHSAWNSSMTVQIYCTPVHSGQYDPQCYNQTDPHQPITGLEISKDKQQNKLQIESYVRP
jgi:hypothetical protein